MFNTWKPKHWDNLDKITEYWWFLVHYVQKTFHKKHHQLVMEYLGHRVNKQVFGFIQQHTRHSRKR